MLGTGDATEPLDLDAKFDVVVAGDLIEHLANFDGFFRNCRRLLKDGGRLVVTSGNPFYADTFLCAAHKKLYVVNPEHTCWICPQTLVQLASRYRFALRDIRFCSLWRSAGWSTADHVIESESYYYDVITDRWTNDSTKMKVLRFGLGKLFRAVYRPYKLVTLTNSRLVKFAEFGAVFEKERE